MGRIKTKLIKRATYDILERHGSEFTEDFGQNKEKLQKFMVSPSKKLRNIIAGYVTRITKRKEEI